jgi:hypothetical protein
MEQEGTMINREPVEEERPIAEDEVEDWEVVEPEESKGSRTIVLSVRFNEDEMRGLRDLARESGGSMADVVRGAVSKYLWPQKGSLVWTASHSRLSPGRVTGTFGFGQDFEGDLASQGLATPGPKDQT